MDFQQNFDTPTMHFRSDGDVSLKQKWNSESQPSTMTENSNGCFDCNICLDSSQDPVVTLCGHLFCWPCIYKWLQVQNSSFDSEERPKCPVCKSYISASSLVPLYGRGTTPSESGAKKPELDLAIPHRPKALNMNALVSATTSVTSQQNHQNTFQRQSHPFNNYSMPASFFSPTINMVGEMVFSTMFRSSDPSMFAYPYPNSYPLTGNGNGSVRLRRQEVQLDKSLNRVSIFLFCCMLLCLILF